MSGYVGGAIGPLEAFQELKILAALRGVLPMQALTKAPPHPRKHADNPFAARVSAVMCGLPAKRRLIKFCDQKEALERLDKNKGQLILRFAHEKQEMV